MAKTLRAVKPKTAQPSRPKIVVYGGPGAGKSYGAVGFPVCYFIDVEDGANFAQYTDRLDAVGGMYMGQAQGATDLDAIIEEVKTLATVKHPFKTLVIDSVSFAYNAEILKEQLRLGDKDAFGASKKPAIQKLKTLLSWTKRLDMNVIFICQEKDVWGDNGKEGTTFDCDPKLGYELHLILRVYMQGASRKAKVGKSRLTAFATGDTFDWSYENFAAIWGNREVMEAEAVAIEVATPEQVAEVKRLLEIVKTPDGWVEKYLAEHDAEDWSAMDGEKVAAVITKLASKLAPVGVAA